MAGAVNTLTKATECANISESFQGYYLTDRDNRQAQIVGLLFVYNHDGKYTSDFDSLVKRIAPQNFIIPKNRKLFILGPYHISYLHNVAKDILQLRGAEKIPGASECTFFYPDMVKTATIQGRNLRAASLEVLTGPWQILRFKRATEGGGIVNESYVYYRGEGQTTQEFKYLIDFLFRYQLVDDGNIIHVRHIPAMDEEMRESSAGIFENAKTEYAAHSHPHAQEYFLSRLKFIKFSTVASMMTQFSEIEIGL